MSRTRCTVSLFGHVVLVLGLTSPLLACVLLHLEWEFGNWVGGGSFPFHAWIVCLPGALAALGGVVAIFAGLVARKPWTFVEGLVAAVLGTPQVLFLPILLGLGAVS